MMLILIVAGSVAHEVMTASKSGSAGDDCASLSISTALDNALAISGAFKCVLFSSDSVTRASAFETVLRAARLGSARGRVGECDFVSTKSGEVQSFSRPI